MNTEHTNQPRQAEPATHSPIALQSIPKRQRDFTAENIRDIAHECMRIGDNEQAAVVFAIADALRDGNLIIQSPAQQQAEPVARDVLAAFGSEVKRACVKAWGAADESHEGKAIEECDITAIVDRYAAQPPAVAAPAELRSVFDEMFDYSVDPTDDVSREWLWRFSKGLVGRLTSKPPAVAGAGAAPDGSVPVPLGFLQAFHALAHNYSLQAQAPDHYAGTERDAFSDAYARCGSELAKLRAMLAAAPQGADPIKRLIAMHNELLGEYPYCYFELAYTRRTDWMAWLCTKPREDDPERKVLACGQGLTAEEACAEAISAAQKGGAA